MITKEDFEAWRQNPVTLEIMTALTALGDGAKREWTEASWSNGNLEPAFLAGLKAKEQTARDLVDMSYEDLTEWQAKE